MTKVKVRSPKAVITTGIGMTDFQICGPRVERLAEFHDVQAALTERRTDRRRRIGLAGRHLKLDVTNNLLCHLSTSSNGP